jgi:Flp pilus assembly protein CpaB
MDTWRPTSPKPGSSFLLGLVLGGCAGFVLATLIAGGLGYLVVKQKLDDVRRNWTLVPVVVAGVAMPEDTTVTYDMMAQRSVPEQFVTASVVKPDSASYIVNQRLRVPVQAGDMLLWTHFETLRRPTVPGMVARRDLAQGTVLSEDDVQERGFPTDLVTESWVLARDLPQAVGKRVTAAFRQGDPILWTHLQGEPEPVVPAAAR